MTDGPAIYERLDLLAFEPLTEHGFALPLFGSAQNPNVWHTATCWPPGDRRGRVQTFKPYVPNSAHEIPQEMRREVRIGSRWVAVFLWNGTPKIGTARELWKELQPYVNDICKRTPLTMLALAEVGPRSAVNDAAKRAFDWWHQKFGATDAVEWRNNSYLRGVLLRQWRRRSGHDVLTGSQLESELAQVRIMTHNSSVQIIVPQTITPIPAHLMARVQKIFCESLKPFILHWDKYFTLEKSGTTSTLYDSTFDNDPPNIINNSSFIGRAGYLFPASVLKNRAAYPQTELPFDLDGKLLEPGVRELSTVRLAQAAATYRAAISEALRERAPFAWAAMQNDLGNVLSMLGEREVGTSRLEDAVAAHRAALEIWTRHRTPVDWAMAQHNLGTALQTLGDREVGKARLQESVAAFREALEVWTRDRVPREWAMTQNNLGNALRALGERDADTTLLEDAVATCRAALEENTRDRLPMAWSATMNNLGNALQTLGEREFGTARLEEAVSMYRLALEERNRESVPLEWATTQNNLGNALLALGRREGSTRWLEAAAEAHRAGLEEWMRAHAPQLRAQSTENLALVLLTLADRSNDAVPGREALALAEAALAEYQGAEGAKYVKPAERLRRHLVSRYTTR